MTVLRHITLCLAMLTLVVTAQAFALARGSADGAGQMVLCTGTGLIAVYVDGQGQPTSAPHICPDAALNVLVDGAVPLVSAPLRQVRFVLVELHAHAPLLQLPRVAPPSRGPPLTV